MVYGIKRKIWWYFGVRTQEKRYGDLKRKRKVERILEVENSENSRGIR